MKKKIINRKSVKQALQLFDKWLRKFALDYYYKIDDDSKFEKYFFPDMGFEDFKFTGSDYGFANTYLNFIEWLVVCMAVDGYSLKIIKQFLDMQHFILPKNIEFKYKLEFTGGWACQEAKFVLCINSFDNINFVDIWNFLFFDKILVWNIKEEKISTHQKKLFLKKIKDDFNFDGYKNKITSLQNKKELKFKCEIKDEIVPRSLFYADLTKEINRKYWK